MALFGTLGEYVEAQESWSQYADRMEQYFIANDIPNPKKAPVFLATIGPAAFRIIGNLVAPKKPSEESFDRLIKVMSDFYNPSPLVTVQRYKFYSRFRHPEESVSTFVAELRNLAKDCDFGTALEDNLRDRLVCGIADQVIQKRLLSEQNLTFKKAFELAQSHESAAKNVMTLQGPTVHQVTTSHNSPCYRCGRKGHPQQECKFKTANCHNCGKVGHIKPVCRSLKSPQTSNHRSFDWSRRDHYPPSTSNSSRPHSSESSVRRPSVHQRSSMSRTSHIKHLADNSESHEEYTLFTVPSHSSTPLFVTITVDNIPIKMEVDTGASFTIISKTTYEESFHSYKLVSTEVRLRTYTGDSLTMFGQFTAKVRYQDQELPLLFIVAGKDGPSLLGRNWLHSLRLDWNTVLSLKNINLTSVLENHSQIFDDSLGTLKGFKVKLFVDSETKPIFCKARPVPYSIRSEVEIQLEKLVHQNILEPIPFSDWAAPIVPVMKPDKSIRICGDFKMTINKVSKLDRYPIPRIEDLFANLSGGISFSKLDLSQAYLQLTLDDDSKRYTVINTHRGLFRYNRLPFGISSAPGIFQRTMESLLKDIPKVTVYLDDILVTGTSEENHLHNLELVLKQLLEAGLHLKKEKCQFLVPSITYLGHKIDSHGLHPLPAKIEAISNASVPKNVTELKAFLGLLNYYGKFIPNLSSVLHPLYQLLSHTVNWSWTPVRMKAFTDAKSLLTSNTLLIHFDPQKDIVLACDASAYGIGAVLSHRLHDGSERPIGFASRTLSSAEQKYSQIEKETLSCVFGVKRFHSFLYGHKFNLITDHKPLLSLIHEHRAIPTTTSNRIQRWAVTLSMYEYSISFKPSTSHCNADALSRLPLSHVQDEPPVPIETVFLLDQIAESPISANQIRSWTRRDPVLSKVLQFILSGWPTQLNPSDISIKSFYNRKLELSTQDGIILWGNRVVVPSPGQQLLLHELHACHPGIARMKSLARMFVWWPGLDVDIERYVKNCAICQSQRSAPPAAPIHPWKWPTQPWYRIHLDLAGPFLGHMFLILMDAHSKWLEVRLLNSTTSSSIISSLRSIFSQFGLPSLIVTDNGRNFTSTEFEQFCRHNGIKHLLSSPYHPSSNGLAERGVQIFKREMLKLKEGTLHDRISHVLFYNHITPQTTTGLSPSQLLQNRNLRSRLDLIRPDVQARVIQKQYTQQYDANSHSKQRSFGVGDPVYIRNFSNGPRWIPGTIKLAIGNVSFEVVVDDGRLF
nr:DDE-type integrase/transposase/recombinase [Gammaproteobacteria bacterium]